MTLNLQHLRAKAEAHVAARSALNATANMNTRAAFLRAREELQLELMPETVLALLDRIAALEAASTDALEALIKLRSGDWEIGYVNERVDRVIAALRKVGQ